MDNLNNLFTTFIKPSIRFSKGKTVIIKGKKNKEIRGWIIDLNENKLNIRFKDSKGKLIEKWYKKTNKNIKLLRK